MTVAMLMMNTVDGARRALQRQKVSSPISTMGISLSCFAKIQSWYHLEKSQIEKSAKVKQILFALNPDIEVHLH